MSRKRASRRRGPNRAPINDINMTPLIDVMLVLLIIFMVAMPVLETGEKVDVAAEGAARNQAPALLVSAEMRMDGSVRIMAGRDKRTADLATLKQAIDALGTPEAGKVYIRAEDKVSYDRYFGLVSAVKGAGLTPVIVAKGTSASSIRASRPPL